ncbi:phosphocarrier protein [Actinomadura rubrobrunea]|uniref:Phosphocarrier protein HPr n=1 Tax=Actinomadura rubrobrunea TaxID=115335 RepID=A0A9W6UVY0_9ACTN|nr:HPr family phosphocarrier protein [Actinomadura rubrobrunea]GLW63707.1 phosphocarrier protein [Actinomadura rubrobrunea]
MAERRVRVGSKVGLHARPAAVFAQAAARLPVRVTIAKPGGDAVDARSMLSVLTLDARHGDEVVLTAPDGDGADAALDELAALVASDLDR